MPDEILDVIDERNQVLGQATKANVHQDGLRHRVGAVLLQRDDGRFLIPTASDQKSEAGSLFHSAAGHVLSSESYREAALRELKEETSLMAERLEFWGAFWFEQDYAARKERERFEVYRVPYHPSMGVVRMNDEQVKEAWLNEAELAAIFKGTPERISGPLQMTCRTIFNFDE